MAAAGPVPVDGPVLTGAGFLAPGPGTRLAVWIPAGHDMLSRPVAAGDGFSLRFAGDLWRSVCVAMSGDDRGLQVELEITGRYEGCGQGLYAA
jgi:hypothetical protein